MISIKIWETPLSSHAKWSPPVAVRVSKTLVLKVTMFLGKTLAVGKTICSLSEAKDLLKCITFIKSVTLRQNFVKKKVTYYYA